MLYMLCVWVLHVESKIVHQHHVSQKRTGFEQPMFEPIQILLPPFYHLFSKRTSLELQVSVQMAQNSPRHLDFLHFDVLLLGIPPRMKRPKQGYPNMSPILPILLLV